MTYKVLTVDTHKVICRSGLRPATDLSSSSLRLDPIDGESLPQYVKFREDSTRESPTTVLDQDRSSPSLSPPPTIVRPILDPADLIGRTFLKVQNDGERHRIHIVQLVDDHLDKVERDP
jgi:hypothetical protein